MRQEGGNDSWNTNEKKKKWDNAQTIIRLTLRWNWGRKD